MSSLCDHDTLKNHLPTLLAVVLFIVATEVPLIALPLFALVLEIGSVPFATDVADDAAGKEVEFETLLTVELGDAPEVPDTVAVPLPAAVAL